MSLEHPRLCGGGERGRAFNDFGPRFRLDLDDQSRWTSDRRENPPGGLVGHPKHRPKMPESEPGARVPHHKAHDASMSFAPSGIVAPIDSHRNRSASSLAIFNDMSRTPAPSGAVLRHLKEPLRSAGIWCNAPPANRATAIQCCMPNLTVEGYRTFEVPQDKRLVLAIEQDAGVDIMHACGGFARCTTCRVEFVEGEPASWTVAERERLAARGLTGIRLSCQILCDHDMVVRAISRLEGTGRPDPGPVPQDDDHPPPDGSDHARSGVSLVDRHPEATKHGEPRVRMTSGREEA